MRVCVYLQYPFVFQLQKRPLYGVYIIDYLYIYIYSYVCQYSMQLDESYEWRWTDNIIKKWLAQVLHI